MRVLLFCDDYYHPGDVPRDGLLSIVPGIDVISDTEGFDPAVLAKYDVVVMSKCDHVSKENNAAWKTAAVQDAFVQYVENGGGLLVTHSGTVAGDDTAVLDDLIGCRFEFHPNNCLVTHGVLKPHPVTAGVATFSEVDEHYKIEILADDIEILAASYSAAQGEAEKYESEPYFNAPACIAPCAYVRTQGKGRVCVLTPGHVIEVWRNAEYAKMLENALKWCAGGG
ncbi:MAG: ThuA domain-containing protein [Defluviitaleaceae bacterium]|nr:ThuA domain-containing protein [Defluviitaleaceae bacterium]